jgi:hypothetical protein
MNDLNKLGKVYLVGAGPGAADLITVRGANLLAKADIVFHDALVDPTMLELCPQAIKEPVGKRCGKLSSAQHFINKRLIDAAHKHQVIVRLKGGDPMMFGRADEEIQALKQANIKVEVVTGMQQLRTHSHYVAYPAALLLLPWPKALKISLTPKINNNQFKIRKRIPWCITWAAKMQPRLHKPSFKIAPIKLPIRQRIFWKQSAPRMSVIGQALLVS